MRLFRRATGIVPSPADTQAAFRDALDERSRWRLGELIMVGALKAHFYYGAGELERPIMHATVPSLIHTARYYPEEWAALIAAADAAKLTLWDWQSWTHLPEGVRYGH